ncbi:MAG: hypothetical protein PHF86_13475 [Candidatus Nanoarchaeia archaeon]|nr:hypothetical protein [Candidatus Nanoarchaeia archaeon]
MSILTELGLLIEAPKDDDVDTDEILDVPEEEPVEEPEVPEEEPEEEANVGEVGDLLKHIESLQNIVQDIDSRVDIQSEDDPAFRAEISIRKAIGALQDLSDKLYKKTK